MVHQKVIDMTEFIMLMISKGLKEKVDSIFYNGLVYTVDSSFSIQEAFAVKNGEFVSVSSTDDIQSNSSDEFIKN